MYKDLLKNDQILFLDFGSLEESYPNITDWKKTSEEVKLMSGKKKRQLAKRVGNEIEQETFEKEMNIIFESLMKAWDKAFK
jgi:signal recognition particle subunit SEC65